MRGSQITSLDYLKCIIKRSHIGLSEYEVENLNLTIEEKTILKPYLNPNVITKYKILSHSKNYLIYSDKGTKMLIANDARFLNIKRHLDKLSIYITSSNSPYGLHRPRKLCYFEKDKIIFKGMSSEPKFIFDEKNIILDFLFVQ